MSKNIISLKPSTPPVYKVFHDKIENIFLDECGKELINIFELITPNDLYLYTEDPGYTIFPHRDDPGLLCEILDLEGEWYEEGLDGSREWPPTSGSSLLPRRQELIH